jgi:SMODS and SLOG-associating 2TM effector domain family 5
LIGRAHGGQAFAMRTDSHMKAPHHLQPRAAEAGGWAEPEQKAKLLYDWQLVKRARFHAADRLERRNSASLITLSMVALYGGLFTVFALLFKDSLSAHARTIFDWMAVVASWLTLTFTLTEQIKDYRGQSRALHDCAQQVNDLRKRLQVTPISSPQHLIPFVEAYEARIRACGPNHDTLDYDIARHQTSKGLDGMTPLETAKRLRRLKLLSRLSTYWVYVLMSAAPLLAGLVAWALVPAAAVTGH